MAAPVSKIENAKRHLGWRQILLECEWKYGSHDREGVVIYLLGPCVAHDRKGPLVSSLDHEEVWPLCPICAGGGAQLPDRTCEA